MKKIGILFMISYYLLLGVVLLTNFSFAQVERWGGYGDDPTSILDSVVAKANQDFEIQETALDGVTDEQGGYAREFKIANTLTYFTNNIQPYIQRAVYVGLTCAVILLIYNGFLMVTNSVHKEGDIEKVKKNVTNIAIGVIVLTGFYAIIKLMVAIINMTLGSNGGESGF